jgi:hypothetical protein
LLLLLLACDTEDTGPDEEPCAAACRTLFEVCEPAWRERTTGSPPSDEYLEMYERSRLGCVEECALAAERDEDRATEWAECVSGNEADQQEDLDSTADACTAAVDACTYTPCADNQSVRLWEWQEDHDGSSDGYLCLY